MGKPKRARELAENEAMAVSRMLRISPQKLNLVAAMIRGKPVSQAMADLKFSKRRIAVDVNKCLNSAVANAEFNHQLDADQLYVAEAYVGKSIQMKRIRTHAKGRYGRVIKPFSRLTIKVREAEGGN